MVLSGRDILSLARCSVAFLRPVCRRRRRNTIVPTSSRMMNSGTVIDTISDVLSWAAESRGDCLREHS